MKGHGILKMPSVSISDCIVSSGAMINESA
jgi:hypothetical protein